MKAVPKRKSAAKGELTRSKILSTSMTLFNRGGVQSVSTKQIAAELGISVGNLHYYFPQKRELIRATLAILQGHLRQALVRPPTAQLPRDVNAYQICVYRSLWDFRFFFNSVDYVSRSDPEVKREYLNLREWSLKMMEDDLLWLQKQGFMVRRPRPNSVRLLAENAWGLWLAWLREVQVEHGSADALPPELLLDALIHHWSLIEPWCAPSLVRYAMAQIKSSGEKLITESDRLLIADSAAAP